jgi:hypothetical protein
LMQRALGPGADTLPDGGMPGAAKR